MNNNKPDFISSRYYEINHQVKVDEHHQQQWYRDELPPTPSSGSERKRVKAFARFLAALLTGVMARNPLRKSLKV